MVCNLSNSDYAGFFRKGHYDSGKVTPSFHFILFQGDGKMEKHFLQLDFADIKDVLERGGFFYTNECPCKISPPKSNLSEYIKNQRDIHRENWLDKTKSL